MTQDPPKKRSAIDDDFGAPAVKSAIDEDFGTPSFQEAQPSQTTPSGAVGGPSSGSGMQQGASQEQPGTLMQPSQLASALDAATKPVQGPPGKFQGYDAQYPQNAPPPDAPAGIEPHAPTNKKPREFAYGEGGFVQKPDGTTIDARDARIERDFADRQGVYSTLNLPGASQYSPQREQAMRDAGTWSDSDELRKKQAPLIIQSDLLRRKQEQLDNDIEKYGIAKVEEQASMLGQDLTYLGEELKKMQESGNADPAAFNEMAAQYNEKLDTYKQQAEILRPFIEEQQDIQGGFEYLQSKHAQAEKEFAQSPTQKTKAARQAMADERFAAAENDIRQGNYLTGNVLDQYVVSPVTATVTSSVLKAAGALGRSLDAWVNIPNAVTGDEANYSRFGSAADNLFDAAEELAPTPKQASQPIFDKEWNMDTHALLPKAMQAATYMAMLGVSGAAAGEPGMVAAGYMTTEEDYYKEAIGVGMKPGEATAFSMTSAALTSLLEKVNPGPLLNGKTVKGAMLERVTKALRDGKNWKEAVKDGTQYVVKEGLGEGGQELLQAGGDDLTKGSAKLAIGERADGLEMNTAQAYAENALLGLSMGTLAAIGGRAMDRPLHMQSLDWAVRNRQKVEDYIKKSGRKDADVLLERLDKISRVYAGNNLTSMPPEQSAKVASLVEQKNDAEKEVKEKPMDPVLEAAIGNPAKQKVNELTTAMIEAMGIPTDKAKAALIGMGMEKAPEGTKLVTNPDGSVTLEKKPETGGATAPTEKASAQPAKKQEPTSNAVLSVFSADEATGVDEEPTAAPAESGVMDSPVSDEAATAPQRIITKARLSGKNTYAHDIHLSFDATGKVPTSEDLREALKSVGEDPDAVMVHPVDFHTATSGEVNATISARTHEEAERIYKKMFGGTDPVNNQSSIERQMPLSDALSKVSRYAQAKELGNTPNEGSATPTEAPAAQAPEDTGDPAGVPPAPEPAARFEPVLTQDVQDDRVSLAAAYEQARMEYRSDMNPDYVIDGILRGAVNEDSFYRFGDRNTKSGPMAKTYFAKKSSGRHMEKSGKTMDVLAQEASEATGREVSPNDLVAHMNQYGSGLPMTNARMRELDQRHGALHGTKLNSLVAKSILAKNKGKVPKFTPNEQAIVDRAEEEGVPIEAVDDQDIEDFDNQSDEDADIMFSGGPSTTYKFDPNAKRGTEQVLPGATSEDAGAVRGDESQGTDSAADKERQALTDQVEEAKAARVKFEKDFKKRAQSLFDTGEVQTRKEAQTKKAPEPGLFQAEGDTRATSSDDFAKAVKPYDDAVASAEKALDVYDNKIVPAKAQAAAAQTRVDQFENDPLGEAERNLEVRRSALAKYKASIEDGTTDFSKVANMKKLEQFERAVSIAEEQVNIQKKKAAAQQTSIDQAPKEQLTPEKGDEAFVKGGDKRVSRMITNFLGDGRVLLEGLSQPVSVSDITIDPKSDHRRMKQKKAEAVKAREAEAELQKAQIATIRKPSATLTPEQMREGFNPKWSEADRQRWDFVRKEKHTKAIEAAVRDGKPVSAAAVEEYGIKMPDGWAQQRELWRPQAPAQAEAPLPKKEETTYEAKARKAAAALEKAKLKPDQLYALPLPPSVWNGAIRAMQEVIIAGGKAADAIAAAIKHIQASDWWKNKATQKEKDEVMSHMQGRISDLETAVAAQDVANLKTNIQQARATGAQKTRTKQQEARKEFVQKVREAMAPLGSRLSAAQAKVLTARAAKVNPTSAASVKKFEKYAEKVIAKADYAEKVAAAEKTAKAIDKAAKKNASEKRDAGLNSIAREFAALDIDQADIDQYTDIANRLLSNLTTPKVNRKVQGPGSVQPLDFAISNKEVSDYIEQQQEVEDAQAEQDIVEEFEQVRIELGLDAASLSPKAMADILAAMNGDEKAAKRLEEQKADEGRKAIMKQTAEAKLSELNAHIASLPEPISKEKQAILDDLNKIDISLLTPTDVAWLITGVNSVVTNDGWGGMRDFAAKGQAHEFWRQNAGKEFGRPGDNFFSKTDQLAMIANKIARGVREAAKFRLGIGLEGTQNAITDAQRQTQEKQARRNRVAEEVGYKDTRLNRYKMMVYGYMTSRFAGTPEEMQAEFDKKAANLRESVTRIKDKDKAFDSVREKAKEYEQAVNEVLGDATSMEALKLPPTLMAMVENERAEFAKNQQASVDSARLDYNKINEQQNDYLPTSQVSVNASTTSADAKKEFERSNFNRRLNTEEASSKQKKTNSLRPNSIIDLDFFKVADESYNEAAADNAGARHVAVMREVMSDPRAMEAMGADTHAMLKNAMIDIVNAEENKKSVFSAGKLFDRIVRAIMRKGQRIALAGIAQYPKQATVGFSTMMALGKDAPLYFGSFRDVTAAHDIDDSWQRRLMQGEQVWERAATLGGLEKIGDPISTEAILTGNESAMAEAAKRFYQKSGKVASFTMKPLAWSDALQAQAAWMAFYKSELKKKGVDLNDPAWHGQKDEEAAAFANQAVEHLQNANTAMSMPAIYRDKGGLKQIMHLAWAYSSFALNMKKRMARDIQTLRNGSKEDKKFARASIAGAVLETLMYSTMAFAITKVSTEIIRSMIDSLWPPDDDEEEKARKAAMEARKRHPASQIALRAAFDVVLGGQPSMLETFEKDKIINPLYAAVTTGDQRPLYYVSDDANLGVLGSVAENFVNLAQAGKVAVTGEAEAAPKGGIMFDERWQVDDRADEGVPKSNDPVFEMAPVSRQTQQMAATVALLSLLELGIFSDQDITRRPGRELRKRMDAELKKMKKEFDATIVSPAEGAGGRQERKQRVKREEAAPRVPRRSAQ